MEHRPPPKEKPRLKLAAKNGAIVKYDNGDNTLTAPISNHFEENLRIGQTLKDTFFKAAVIALARERGLI